MALDDIQFARLFVDPAVPRAELIRLSAGTTPAKLARVMSLLRPAELTLAMTKMRARRTPSNQAHVTNRLDDPLLLAADAATAAAFGFREIETTVPVLADAPSNAVAVTIGSCIGAAGILVQCSVEEAMELEMGIRGLVSYAETVSLYGTEDVFVDGDDTPYSKAILAAAYASRGVKMRVSSGAGAEVLMGGAAHRSMLYLESRCVSLARALGVQGVQNGGIDGASVAGAVPRGVRELMAENVMVMARNLEACTGNDALMSESDVRRTSRTLPILLAGSDYVCSGFGSIQRYDNMFGPSQWNAEDIDDWLAMQRDWGVDGGLRTADPDEVGRLRREAAEACRDVYRYLGLADFGDDHVELAVDAVGSKDLGDPDPMVVLSAAQTVRSSGHRVARGGEGAAGVRVRRRRDAAVADARGAGARRPPPDRGDLRRADERAEPRHRPQRLRGSRHRLRAVARAAARDRHDPPGQGRRGPARTTRRSTRPTRSRSPATPSRAATRARWSSASPPASVATCGGRCPGSPSSRCSTSCSPVSRRRAAPPASCA